MQCQEQCQEPCLACLVACLCPGRLQVAPQASLCLARRCSELRAARLAGGFVSLYVSNSKGRRCACLKWLCNSSGLVQSVWGVHTLE